MGIRDLKHGKNFQCIEPVNIYECSLGDDVFVGPFAEIQKDVVVGNRTRIQSHSFICSLVTIGDDCFIGHGVMFTNDKFHNSGPARHNENFYGKTQIGDRVSIGSNATILPVIIVSDVIIGAGSVVTKNIDVPGVYCGNPAVRIK